MKNRYWRYFPEMERFADDAARKAAWKRASSETIHRPAYWAVMLLLVVVASIMLILIIERMGLLASLGPIGGGAIAGALGGLIGGSIFWFYRGSVTQSLRRQLNESGIPTCMKCGYDLRGCGGGRCSECGATYSRPVG